MQADAVVTTDRHRETEAWWESRPVKPQNQRQAIETERPPRLRHWVSGTGHGQLPTQLSQPASAANPAALARQCKQHFLCNIAVDAVSQQSYGRGRTLWAVKLVEDAVSPLAQLCGGAFSAATVL